MEGPAQVACDPGSTSPATVGNTIGIVTPMPMAWAVPPAELVSSTFDPASFGPTLGVTPSLRRCVVDADRVTGASLDVISGLYEGGAKVWECTRDLLAHMATQPVVGSCAIVADIGCGAGLLGIAALQAGASQCLFSDMNESVLTHVTSPNIRVNLGIDGFGRCSLLAGPWASVVAAASNPAEPRTDRSRLSPFLGSVDVALASEVLYNVAYYGDLCALLRALLRPGSGVALIATKRFYYGVGGGTESFITVATSPRSEGGPGLAVRKVAAFQDGSSMIRDLLEVRVPSE